jgi:hypothetical protein
MVCNGPEKEEIRAQFLIACRDADLGDMLAVGRRDTGTVWEMAGYLGSIENQRIAPISAQQAAARGRAAAIADEPRQRKNSRAGEGAGALKGTGGEKGSGAGDRRDKGAGAAASASNPAQTTGRVQRLEDEMRHRYSERELQTVMDEHWLATATLSTESSRPAHLEPRVRMVGLQRAVAADARANTVAYREQGNCFTCKLPGHYSYNCPSSGARAAPARRCYRCNEEGHISVACPMVAPVCDFCSNEGHVLAACRVKRNALRNAGGRGERGAADRRTAGRGGRGSAHGSARVERGRSGVQSSTGRGSAPARSMSRHGEARQPRGDLKTRERSAAPPRTGTGDGAGTPAARLTVDQLEAEYWRSRSLRKDF